MLYYTEETYYELGDEVIMESSKGKLKSSFRTCVNPENGHMIKVVFDLDPMLTPYESFFSDDCNESKGDYGERITIV